MVYCPSPCFKPNQADLCTRFAFICFALELSTNHLCANIYIYVCVCMCMSVCLSICVYLHVRVLRCMCACAARVHGISQPVVNMNLIRLFFFFFSSLRCSLCVKCIFRLASMSVVATVQYNGKEKHLASDSCIRHLYSFYSVENLQTKIYLRYINKNMLVWSSWPYFVYYTWTHLLNTEYHKMNNNRSKRPKVYFNLRFNRSIRSHAYINWRSQWKLLKITLY